MKPRLTGTLRRRPVDLERCAKTSDQHVHHGPQDASVGGVSATAFVEVSGCAAQRLRLRFRRPTSAFRVDVAAGVETPVSGLVPLSEPGTISSLVSESEVMAPSESSSGDYLIARIAAFVRAHATERLCPECVGARWRGVAGQPIEEPGWCMRCGARSSSGVLVSSLAFKMPSSGRRRRQPSDSQAA